MTTSKQYLQAIKRLGLLFNKESQLTDIIGAKDLDKAENCDAKFSILCHKVTKFSQEMGMEVNLRDLLDDYELVENIIKEVKKDNPNLLPKIQLEKGHKVNEKTAMEILDSVMYPKELPSADNRLKYNTMQDIAQALKTGNGNDDECQDYEYRRLQRTVIMVLITIGAIPLNKNSEPKDIKADNEYAYQFFEKYILGKLPESNLNVGGFAPLDAWKNLSQELPDEFDKDDCLYCMNRLNIISVSIHVVRWFYKIIVHPGKYTDWLNSHITNPIPEELTLADPENANILYRMEKADSWQYYLEKYEVALDPDQENPTVIDYIREMDKEIADYKTIIKIIKKLREIKKVKDDVLIRPLIMEIQEKLNPIVFDLKDELMLLTNSILTNTSDTYNILNNKSDYFAELTEYCKNEIEESEKLKEYLNKYLHTSQVKVTRYIAFFQVGDDNAKYFIIAEPNNNLTFSNYKARYAIFLYIVTEECLVMELARNSDGSQGMPEWLNLPINKGVTYLIIDDSIKGTLKTLSKLTYLEETNPKEWMHKLYCEEVGIVTKEFIYCKIFDSEQYYRIKRKNNSVSENFQQLISEDSILIFSMKENPDKVLLSVGKLGIEMKDITGNPDFEIVDKVEF